MLPCRRGWVQGASSQSQPDMTLSARNLAAPVRVKRAVLSLTSASAFPVFCLQVPLIAFQPTFTEHPLCAALRPPLRACELGSGARLCSTPGLAPASPWREWKSLVACGSWGCQGLPVGGGCQAERPSCTCHRLLVPFSSCRVLSAPDGSLRIHTSYFHSTFPVGAVFCT